MILSIFIVIAMAVCWHSTDESGFGQQEMSVACLVGTRPAYSEQIAIVGENIGFRFKKIVLVIGINGFGHAETDNADNKRHHFYRKE